MVQGGRCTPGVPGPGSVPWLHCAAWSAPVHAGVLRRTVRRQRRDSLGSEASHSLGKVVPRARVAQGRHASSRVLPGKTTRARGGRSRCLDRHRAICPLINLELDNGGESPIPVPPGVDERKDAEYHRFITFVDFAQERRAGPLRTPLCVTSCTSPRVE